MPEGVEGVPLGGGERVMNPANHARLLSMVNGMQGTPPWQSEKGGRTVSATDPIAKKQLGDMRGRYHEIVPSNKGLYETA
jgi:hypothetical protein